MEKLIKLNLPIILFLISIAFVNSIPTSVLVNTKDVNVNNSKVKRSSNTNSSPSSSDSTNPKSDNDLDNAYSSLSSATLTPSSSSSVVNSINKKSSEFLLDSNQAGLSNGVIEPKSTPQKRGVNSQLLYNDIFNNGLQTSPGNGGSSSSSFVALPNGVWNDEIDPSIMYQDLQDFEDYPRGTYRTQKPYENLERIWNGDGMYSEPVALPLQYPYRYYGDRKKRSNKNSFDMRLKRESKLTPADMLALVALVEAGERSRHENENQDNDNEELLNDYARSYLTPYGSQQQQQQQQIDNLNEYNGNSWVDPAIDYYGMPYNLDTIPRYDVLKDQKFTSNYYPSKRYMITKKKRSLNHYHNKPLTLSGYSSLNTRFGTSTGPKGLHQKYF